MAEETRRRLAELVQEALQSARAEVVRRLQPAFVVNAWYTTIALPIPRLKHFPIELTFGLLCDTTRPYADHMSSALVWDVSSGEDDHYNKSTVTGRLRQRQRSLVRRRTWAKVGVALLENAHEDDEQVSLAGVIPINIAPSIKMRIAAEWRGGPNVLAFLFAMPDSDAIRLLDARGDYFDVRTGKTWDLFFPGYHDAPREKSGFRPGIRRVGKEYARTWRFSTVDFDNLRQHIEDASERRWVYSGGTDLVLINCWLPDRGEPTIDWTSTISGQLTDHAEGTQTLTLANIIERITDDLQHDLEDPAYGVTVVTDETPPPPGGHVTRDVMTNALGGIAAALMARAMGVS